MITLLQLKNYLQVHGPTTLVKLANEFAEEPKTIMCLADHYIAKGKICCEQQKSNCGSCQGCFASTLVKLSWVG